MAVNMVHVTADVTQCDAPADTGACDEFDAALGKVSSLTVVHDSAKSKKHGGARLLRKCALVDADGKELCHILVTDDKPVGSSKLPVHSPPFFAFKAVVQLPDGRKVFTVKNDGCEKMSLREDGLIALPLTQVMDRGDAGTIEVGNSPSSCLAPCILGYDNTPVTLTHSVAGAQNVALVPNVAQNAAYNKFMCAYCAVGYLTFCAGAIFIRCFVRAPDMHRHLVTVTDTAPLGAGVAIKDQLCLEGLAESCTGLKGPKKIINFEANAPLQARKDMIALIAYVIGGGMITQVRPPSAF